MRMSSRKPVIGICGGVGAGKSTVAAEFGRQGGLVISSDELNRQILERPEVVAELERWWGPAVRRPDGGPDRARIAEFAFTDAASRRRLESLLHPLIAAERAAIITRSSTDPAIKAIILDSPLLFESNLDQACDAIVFVEASADCRRHRLQRTRNWDRQQLARREQWQWPLAEKRKRSGYIVSNEGSLTDLEQQVREILERILA
jgi:dephospho-CoA kinase